MNDVAGVDPAQTDYAVDGRVDVGVGEVDLCGFDCGVIRGDACFQFRVGIAPFVRHPGAMFGIEIVRVVRSIELDITHSLGD